jgi:hypothetical protein
MMIGRTVVHHHHQQQQQQVPFVSEHLAKISMVTWLPDKSIQYRSIS